MTGLRERIEALELAWRRASVATEARADDRNVVALTRAGCYSAHADELRAILVETDRDAMTVADACEHCGLFSCEGECQDDDPVLGHCPHGVDLDRAFCPQGCRV